MSLYDVFQRSLAFHTSGLIMGGLFAVPKDQRGRTSGKRAVPGLRSPSVPRHPKTRMWAKYSESHHEATTRSRCNRIGDGENAQAVTECAGKEALSGP